MRATIYYVNVNHETDVKTLKRQGVGLLNLFYWKI